MSDIEVNRESKQETKRGGVSDETTPKIDPAKVEALKAQGLKGDLLWYKDAIIYQLHVRAFSDSNGDGIGDFKGLTQKLDYLAELGVSAIWMLPFYPSPLKDDGYDIADYTNVNPSYGTIKDFQHMMAEAHKRGLRVITELVINHTSDQHEWFQKSRRAKEGTFWRDFYVWSDNPNKYKGTRISRRRTGPGIRSRSRIIGTVFILTSQI
jgi:maltose alpha-D-glucosyltransferase / alpha-amylase